MATKTRTLLHFLLLSSLFLISTSLALSYQTGDTHDPARRRYDECRQRCDQHRHDEQKRRQCEGRCEEKYEEERRGGRGESDAEDPKKKLKECQERCQQWRHDREKVRQCQEWCEESAGREGLGRVWRYDNTLHRRGEEEREKEREGESSEEDKPYFFGRESFRQRVRTEHGHVRVLENFAKKSLLLAGIANYRIGVLDAAPHAFILPHHLDADRVIFVAKGKPTITLMCQGKKETHNLNEGDIIKAPSGAITYMVNRDSNERLCIIEFMNPVATPGHVESFMGVGSDPDSFYKQFSSEIMKAAFNTRIEKLERLFGKQKKGAIVRASEQQVRALSQHASEGGRQWPFGGGDESIGSFNLFNKRAAYSSQRGQIYEADGEDYHPLRDLDVQVSFANLTRGSMIAPYYNSRATKIAIFTDGEGEVEIICPHLAKQEWKGESGGRRGESSQSGKSSEEERGEGQHYKKVRSRVSKGSVVVIPAGHPSAVVASGGENLQGVCFEIWTEKNEKIFLAGRNNVWSQMDREAKELSFDMPAREVDAVFSSQEEEILLAGPRERERHREGTMEDVLELAAGVFSF